ncbi:Calcineurin-like phosphoesterase [Carpediemonas membranifera]|uniref:Serine/threonine-protein phosphatase n=1 Tax=Carpediemonas membranifera TaxID=201153 RepID=A0A8J6E2G7_9EUKA|nr:Calcineurin-like phosphoesterase [Carpediemonas membranifera]|eukprot:KAG9394673.1 Calcineurin-like phosphoesterase [Carpediemonas membranifera]
MSKSLDRDIEQLTMNCKCPSEESVLQTCSKVIELLRDDPNVIQVRAPASICGDIHGQFYDLKELFSVGGDCPNTNYVFMGDFVDRGFYSVETLLWLLMLKVKHPQRLNLIRGNHESRQITQVYGFYDECLKKFSTVSVWRSCTCVFDHIALAAIVENHIFCVHGGLSPSGSTIDLIQNLDRVQEVPHDGIMCDLMWSDPEAIDGWGISPRGAGYLFGATIVDQFLRNNRLGLVARAHQLVMDGYRFMFDDRAVTVWSAPNYCYRCGNRAAIFEYDGVSNDRKSMDKRFRLFTEAPSSQRLFPSRRNKVPDYFL